MIIIGLHNGHDAGITFFRDGVIENHWELERYMNRKHYAGIHNKNSIFEFLFGYVLPKKNINFKDIDIFCLSSLYAGWWGKMWKNTELAKTTENKKYSNITNGLSIFWDDIWRYNIQTKFFASLHHMNHMAYGYYTSPFKKALIFAYDGEGDFNMTTSCALGINKEIKYLSDIDQNKNGLKTNYIGKIYSQLNKLFPFLGKCDFAVPGKIMGLSSYGKPNNKWKKIIISSLQNGDIKKLTKNLSFPNDPNSNDVQDFLATFQEECEILIIETIKKLLEMYPNENLVISGGCGLNVLINSKLSHLVKNIYIPPACSDVGQSIGSVLYCWHNILNNGFSGINWHDPYIGDQIWNKEYLEKLPLNIKSKKYEDQSKLINDVAKLLQQNKIIAWSQGRTEIGPRSLGNRSILCSPISKNMKNIINSKVKHREWWRPFAPICLEKEYKNWFNINHEQPYMLEAPSVIKEKQEDIPAVTHIDGTSRIQTVKENQNKILHKLLTAFKEKTGIPILLNTSLNDKGKPIANNCKDIVDLLEKTDLDYAVIDNILLSKRKNML